MICQVHVTLTGLKTDFPFIKGIELIISVLFVSCRLADLMEEHQEELATIESLDSGAVYTLALKTHIGMSIATLRYFAGWADKIQVKFLSLISKPTDD